MKRNKVFVIPVVLLLFVLLPKILHAAQGRASQRIIATNVIGLSADKLEFERLRELFPVMNESYSSNIDPFHQMMDKRIGDPRQWRESHRYPIRERDGIKDLLNHVFRKKRPERKTDAINIPADTWKIEAVDAPKYFTDFYSRAIAVDAGNYPHMAYGGDHLYYAYYDGNIWNYQTVDSSPAVGAYASIALDTSGKTYISYYDVANGDLKYATNVSGSWVTTTVDSSGDVGWYTSIAADASGNVHISYLNLTNGDLKYATNSSGSWITTTVDSSGDVGWYTSIAVDVSGNVHISYLDYTNGDLRYATNGSGSWVAKTVASSGYIGRFTSIAVDTSGKVHISYQGNGDLKYTTNGSGSWVTTTVDSSGYVGRYTSIAVDTLGKAHISYQDYPNHDLKYATNGSGSWATTTVDSSGDVGLYTSIAVDTPGNVHISYLDYTNGDLRYATNGSGSWVTTTVDSSGDVGLYTSIALDTLGKAHISYLDFANGDLKYATNGSGSWVTTTVDSSVDAGKYTSIAVDTLGKVHISYYDDYNGDLKYATNVSDSWITTTVDSSADVGKYTSIAVDTLDKAHISYFDDYNGDLKYATNVSDSWITTTVDSGGVGLYTSLAMDTSGKAHISYFDDYNGDLKYATNSSGSWITTTVDSSGYVGWYTAIALDTLGKVHMSYSNYHNGDLKYATNASGSWETKTVDSSGDVGWYTSIAVDTSDKAHISYFDNTNRDLKYATNASGAWVLTTVDSSGDVGRYTSIALDTLGKVHISYYDGYFSYDLKYATNADTTPPTVVSTNPIDGATGVPVNSSITITFSEAMDASTINDSTFTLSNGATGTVSYDDTTQTATFTPSADLNYDTIYTATVIKDVKDLAGNPIASDFVWSFTTAPAPDITPPAIVSTNPLNDAIDVDVNTAITAAFSEAMDASTISDSTFTVSNGATGTVSYDDTTQTATFTPSSNLTYSTTYTATITTGVKDLAGNPMSADYVWSFTTEPDITPPTVISTNPLNNAIDVDINTVITATFSEPIDETTMNTSTFIIDGVTGTVSYDPATKMATYTPSAILNYATTYTATVIKDVKDLAGNPMESDFVWSFITAPAPDVTPPTIISTNPLDVENNVAVDTTIAATFSEAMDAFTINDSTFTVSNGATGTVSYDDTTKTATFTPSSNLTYATPYTATITTGVKDLAGNAMTVDYSWGFTTTSPSPASPITLAAKAISSSGIVLTWQDISDTEKGFKIERKMGTCDSGNDWSEITIVGADVRTYTDTGLFPHTQYSYRVRAYNAGGDSDYSRCGVAMTGLSDTPNVPTNLKAVSVSENKVNLSWTDNSTDETEFHVYRRTGTGAWILLAKRGENVTSFHDTTATGNASTIIYSYYVTACNNAGCSPRTSSAVVPFSPPAFTAEAFSSDQINLSWTSVKATRFQIQRMTGDCASADSWRRIATVGGKTINYNNTGLSSGMTYSYKLRAYSRSYEQPYAYGYSLWSDCDDATTP